MNRTQQHSSLPVSEDFTVPITLPRAPGFAEAPYQMLAGKLTRLLARNVPTKKLTMRNTRPLVSFTFDDAAATACTAGAALLEQFHARGTFYISGEKCGKPSPTGRLATTEQLQALHAKGHEIACHTFSHMRVVGISRQALKSDLDRNRSSCKAFSAISRSATSPIRMATYRSPPSAISAGVTIPAARSRLA